MEGGRATNASTTYPAASGEVTVDESSPSPAAPRRGDPPVAGANPLAVTLIMGMMQTCATLMQLAATRRPGGGPDDLWLKAFVIAKALSTQRHVQQIEAMRVMKDLVETAHREQMLARRTSGEPQHAPPVVEAGEIPRGAAGMVAEAAAGQPSPSPTPPAYRTVRVYLPGFTQPVDLVDPTLEAVVALARLVARPAPPVAPPVEQPAPPPVDRDVWHRVLVIAQELAAPRQAQQIEQIPAGINGAPPVTPPQERPAASHVDAPPPVAVEASASPPSSASVVARADEAADVVRRTKDGRAHATATPRGLGASLGRPPMQIVRGSMRDLDREEPRAAATPPVADDLSAVRAIPLPARFPDEPAPETGDSDTGARSTAPPAEALPNASTAVVDAVAADTTPAPHLDVQAIAAAEAALGMRLTQQERRVGGRMVRGLRVRAEHDRPAARWARFRLSLVGAARFARRPRASRAPRRTAHRAAGAPSRDGPPPSDAPHPPAASASPRCTAGRSS